MTAPPANRLCAGPLTTVFIPPAACSTAAVGWQSRRAPDPNLLTGAPLAAGTNLVAFEHVSAFPYCLLAPTQSNPCYPPVASTGLMDFRFDVDGAFYSPAFSCPVGWTTAYTATQTGGIGSVSATATATTTMAATSVGDWHEWVVETMLPGEMAAVCCPEGYTLSPNAAASKLDCVRTVITPGATPAVACPHNDAESRNMATSTISFGPGRGSTAAVATATASPPGPTSLPAVDLWIVETAKPVQINWQVSDLAAAATAPTDASANTDGGDGGLGTGAKAGIAVGGVFAAIFFGLVLFLLLRRRNRKTRQRVLTGGSGTRRRHGAPGAGKNMTTDKGDPEMGTTTTIESGGKLSRFSFVGIRPKGKLHQDIAELPTKKFSIYELPANETPELSKPELQGSAVVVSPSTPPIKSSSPLAKASSPTPPSKLKTAEATIGEAATAATSAATAHETSTFPYPKVKPKPPRRKFSYEDAAESPIVRRGTDEVFAEDMISPLTPQTTSGTTREGATGPGNLRDRSWLA